jgi:hypothetical protein
MLAKPGSFRAFEMSRARVGEFTFKGGVVAVTPAQLVKVSVNVPFPVRVGKVTVWTWVVEVSKR